MDNHFEAMVTKEAVVDTRSPLAALEEYYSRPFSPQLLAPGEYGGRLWAAVTNS